jgi:hypothetical protein
MVRDFISIAMEIHLKESISKAREMVKGHFMIKKKILRKQGNGEMMSKYDNQSLW